MKPTTTGYLNAKTWKGWEASADKEKVGDLEAVRGENGTLYSRWKTESWRERLCFLFTGRLWIGVMADKQPPVTCIIGPKLALLMALAVFSGCASNGDLIHEATSRRNEDRSLRNRIWRLEERVEDLDRPPRLNNAQRAHLECGCGKKKLEACSRTEILSTIGCLEIAAADFDLTPSKARNINRAIRYLRTLLQNRALDPTVWKNK